MRCYEVTLPEQAKCERQDSNLQAEAQAPHACVYTNSTTFAWCPRQESNLHAEAYGPKPYVSTNSTTGACVRRSITTDASSLG